MAGDHKIVNGVAVPLTPEEQAEHDARAAAHDPVAIRRSLMIGAVKSEAARRITALVPEWRQRNLLARGFQLLRKGTTAWSPEDSTEADALETAFARIAAVRTRSDSLEATVAGMDGAALDAFDPRDDANWEGA